MKKLRILICVLVFLVVLIACDFSNFSINPFGSGEEDARIEGEDEEEKKEIPKEIAEDLPAGGCSENLGKIVFSYDPEDRKTVHYGIFVMNSDGSGRVRLSDEEELHHKMPSWSPERCRIAFVSTTVEGDDDIYVMNADGSSIQRLTTDPARDMFPDWSPDGKQIVFVSYRNGGIRNLWIMNADGSDQHQLTFNPEEYSQWEQWSPVGDEIAYCYNVRTGSGEPDIGGRIYLVNADGSNKRQLTPDAGPLGDLDMTWSPDGSKIYFISNRSSHSVEIWEINVDGSGLRQVTSFGTGVFVTHSLRTSPDGMKLAFYGIDQDVGQHSTEIYVVNVDGSGLTDITLSEGSEEWLDW